MDKRLLKDLQPYDRNPRKNKEAVDRVLESLNRHGQVKPIVISAKGKPFEQEVIVAGHTTLEALKRFGAKEAFVVVKEFADEAQFLDYNIRDNKTGEYAQWDEAILAELAGQFDIDLSEMGFEFEAEENKEGNTDPDDVPEVPAEPTAKLGQMWKLGDHRLLCGDSTDRAQVERLMGGEKADMVFTDPPYGVDYKGINNDDPEGLPSLLDGAFSNYFEHSKSGASIYVFHSDRMGHIFREAFNKYFHFSSMVIWAKNSLTLSQTDYQSQHEPCLYGWMNNGTHSWHSDRKQTSIWRFDKERCEGHTTPKPIELVSYGIKNSSKSDDLILDLFGGSGSTLIACEKTGRKCRMMELDEKYVSVIIERWQAFTGKDAVLIETGQTYNEMKNASN